MGEKPKAGDYRARYAFVGSDEEVMFAGQALDVAVLNFVEAVAEIRDGYPAVGLGDTTTDEAIIGYVYSKIHWGGE